MAAIWAFDDASSAWPRRARWPPARTPCWVTATHEVLEGAADSVAKAGPPTMSGNRSRSSIPAASRAAPGCSFSISLETCAGARMGAGRGEDGETVAGRPSMAHLEARARGGSVSGRGAPLTTGPGARAAEEREVWDPGAPRGVEGSLATTPRGPDTAPDEPDAERPRAPPGSARGTMPCAGPSLRGPRPVLTHAALAWGTAPRRPRRAPDDDPHRERDLGAVEVEGTAMSRGIDLLDREPRWAGPRPEDPATTARVLTMRPRGDR